MATLVNHATLLLSISSVVGQWVNKTDPPLPVANYGMAVGAYNDSIWLLGGNVQWEDRQLTEYKVNTNEMIYTPYFSPSSIEGATGGDNQFYTQIGHKLYILKNAGYYLTVFDMKTNELFQDYISLPTIRYSYCLTNDGDRIYPIGGVEGSTNTLKNLQIYTINTGEWTNGPDFQTYRQEFTCNTGGGKIWIIGGQSNSIEYINASSLDQWYYTTQGLSNAVTDPQSVTVRDIIYVVGGNYYSSKWISTDKVHLIDTVQNTVTVSADLLPYGVHHAPLIEYNFVLYVFGGYSNGVGALDSWMTYDLGLTRYPTSGTNDPTEVPTFSPSSITTNPTTNEPSNDPSVSPTKYPTFLPTLYPTVYPTLNPLSLDPTTSEPSSDSTTDHPTLNPTISIIVSTETNVSQSNVDGTNNDSIVIVVVVALIVSILLIFVFCVVIKKRLYQKHLSVEENIGERYNNLNIDSNIEDQKDEEKKPHEAMDEKEIEIAGMVSNGDDDNETAAASGEQEKAVQGQQNEGCNDRKMIEDLLKECDKMEWMQYLANFDKHKINDERLRMIPENDGIWRELIPEYGVLFTFKEKWFKQNTQITQGGNETTKGDIGDV